MKKSPTHILAANTKRLRETFSWSQSELSRRSGIPQRTISAIENAAHNTSVESLEGLGKAFGVPPWALLFDDIDLALFTRNGLDKLIHDYAHLPEASRQEIKHVAEREQRYCAGPSAPPAPPTPVRPPGT